MKAPLTDIMRHHPWCNYFLMCRPEGCRMCEDLREHYPEDRPVDEMMKKHFPDVVEVKDDTRRT